MGTQLIFVLRRPQADFLRQAPVVPHQMRDVLDQARRWGRILKKRKAHSAMRSALFMVGRAGLEPATLCLKGRYSTD